MLKLWGASTRRWVSVLWIIKNNDRCEPEKGVIDIMLPGKRGEYNGIKVRQLPSE
jgi:hypothetical protein